MENGLTSSNGTDGAPDDVEVQKLKDLVKKLEKQNEHLRNRTGRLSSNASKFSKPANVAAGDAVQNQTSVTDVDDVPLFEDNDDLLTSVCTDDESSWLFMSPVVKSKSCDFFDNAGKKQSPQDWLTDELEHPKTPQLAAAKKNILSKLEGSLDIDMPDISYLQKSIEQKLSFADEYKYEDATDVQVTARLQQDELRKGSPSYPRENSFDASPVSHRPKHGSVEDETEWNSSSSGSPHHTHHLPVPSQTMTTAHGLYPSACVDEEQNTLRRPRTPTRMERSHNVHVERRGSSPRARSPAQKPAVRNNVRRSLPDPTRTQTPTSTRTNSNLVTNSLPGDFSPNNSRTAALSNDHTTPSPNQPLIKSALSAPPSRLSKLATKSNLPSSLRGRSIPAPRSKSPMTSQQPARRSLPRPSQTSTSMKYMQSSGSSSKLNTTHTPSPKLTPLANSSPNPAQNTPPADIWADDDEVY
uniref:SLAIN motif-containing protein 1-like n=1 Tax=Phallusia mammillata TaxID=59560 RepID=A0A6F9DRM3_9ASCI|nr:SLAIN motif-containing protein 1-like [Phallusia mammillata]